MAKPAPLLPVLDLTHPRLFVLPRSLGCLAITTSALDFLHPNFSLLPRALAHLNFPVTLPGLACIGSVSSLPVPDSVHSDSLMSLRSLARLGSTVLVLDFLHPGLTTFLRAFCHLGVSFFIFGMTWLGSLLSMLDSATLSPSSSLRSCA